MSKNIDNKIEKIFLEIILKNEQLNGEILKIYDLINEQNISSDDKGKIIKKVIGINIIDENDEINNLYNQIINNDLRDFLLYKLIFELVESILNTDDKEHLIFLLSATKEEVETDVIYFLRDIFELIYIRLKEFFSNKRTFRDLISKDYLDDNELTILLKEIDIFFENLISKIINSEEKENISKKIINEINKKYQILSIK